MTKPPKAAKSLPARFRGAAVVRGRGMTSTEIDALVDQEALDQFDATKEIFLVIEDGALADLDGSVEVRGFIDEAVAIRYAQARANGTVDHRVLRVREQTLVVATMHEL